MAYQKYNYKIVREASKDRDDAIYQKVSERTGVPKEVVAAVIETGFKTLGQAMKHTLTGKDVAVVFPHLGLFYSTEEYKVQKKQEAKKRVARNYAKRQSNNETNK